MSTASASRSRGRSRELRYIAHLRDDKGWTAYRVDGAGDIVAGKDGVTLLIQVKSTLTPYAHFLPADRQRLREDADRAGWFAALLWWPKGRGLERAELIPEHDWPDADPSPDRPRLLDLVLT